MPKSIFVSIVRFNISPREQPPPPPPRRPPPPPKRLPAPLQTSAARSTQACVWLIQCILSVCPRDQFSSGAQLSCFLSVQIAARYLVISASDSIVLCSLESLLFLMRNMFCIFFFVLHEVCVAYLRFFSAKSPCVTTTNHGSSINFFWENFFSDSYRALEIYTPVRRGLCWWLSDYATLKYLWQSIFLIRRDPECHNAWYEYDLSLGSLAVWITLLSLAHGLGEFHPQSMYHSVSTEVLVLRRAAYFMLIQTTAVPIRSACRFNLQEVFVAQSWFAGGKIHSSICTTKRKWLSLLTNGKIQGYLSAFYILSLTSSGFYIECC